MQAEAARERALLAQSAARLARPQLASAYRRWCTDWSDEQRREAEAEARGNDRALAHRCGRAPKYARQSNTAPQRLTIATRKKMH
eukprot:6816430-Prymnesium_polylepis.1